MAGEPTDHPADGGAGAPTGDPVGTGQRRGDALRVGPWLWSKPAGRSGARVARDGPGPPGREAPRPRRSPPGSPPLPLTDEWAAPGQAGDETASDRSDPDLAEPAGELRLEPLAGPAHAAPVEPWGRRLRRWGEDHGWVLVAAGLVAVVALCAVPILAGPGLTWRSGGDDTAPRLTAPAGLPPVAATPNLTPSSIPASVEPSPSRSVTPAASASTARPVLLGPPSESGLRTMLDGYCAATVNRSRTAGLDGDQWVCLRPGHDPEIDLTAACRWRYGPAAYAQAGAAGDPFGWRCYRR